MMRNKLTGVVGSALACCLAELVVNVIGYGFTWHLQVAAVGGLIMGAIVGGLIAVFGSDRPVVAGLIVTSVIFAALIGSLTFFHITAMHSAFDALLVVATVAGIGLANGFGYRLLGPKTE